MDEQLDLLGPTKSRPATHSLFLAIFPDPATVQRMAALAADLRGRHRLAGRLRPLDHLHLTLHWLGDYPEVPDSMVKSVGQACAAVTARVPAFEVCLTHVTSFRGRPGNNPLVLSGSEEDNAALMKFHQGLITELAKTQRLGAKNLKFKPHTTLLYDKQSLSEELASPVTWTVNEIVLVSSEVGATKYHHHGRWPLSA